MGRDDVVRVLAQHHDALAALGVRRLAVFGSYARDEADPDSDIDILVEFDAPTTFNAYMDVKFYLEDLLACRIDLVTRRALRPEIAAQVLKEAVYVA